ncbi:MAG TPA: hypothetical protein VGH87_12110 [Polyangiaceae bacterium]
MRARRFVVSLAAVSLLVVACAPAAKDAQSPGCVMATRMFPPCTADAGADSPEKLQSMRQTAIRRKANLERALTAFCPDDVTAAALRVQDACVASVDAALPQVTADASTRRAAAGPAVAALRADARYTPARDKFHAARVQQAVACDTDDGAACKLARDDAERAAVVMRGLLGELRIDPRDADALGLW